MFRALILMFLVLHAMPLRGQAEESMPRGVLLGQVLDQRSGQPLVGANLSVIDSPLGTSTDLEGRFRIAGVEAGVRSLRISMLGYRPRLLSDLVVRPGRSDALRIELEPTSLELEELTIRPSFFAARTASGAVTRQFHREEIRRAAGSAEDVNRIMQALPSVGMGSLDERNDLIVRGGTPLENLFLVDGHPIHNINHFGSQGSTGGPLGMIHVDFIDQVRFSPGGFDSRYGNRLSSVMDVRFREGSREAFGGEAFLSMAGAGVEAEGPLGSAGSWLFGARRSYLELLKEQIGYATAPVLADLGGKVVLDGGVDWRVELLLLSSLDHTRWNVDDDPDQNYNVDLAQGSIGGGLRLVHAGNGPHVDRLRVTLNHQDFNQEVSLWNGTNQVGNDAWERTISLEAERLLPGSKFDLRMGLGTEFAASRHRVSLVEVRDAWGQLLPDRRFTIDHHQYRSWLFLQSTWRPGPRNELQAGLRLVHDSFLERQALQPRLGWRHQIAPDLHLQSAFGVYAQSLPVYWLVQSEANAGLDFMGSRHLQTGLEWTPRPDLLLSLGGFHRAYHDLPVSSFQRELPLAAAGSSYGYSYLGQLFSEAEGRSYGIEALIQKKLMNGVYGSWSWSWSLARYKAAAGSWLPGPFDRRHMSTLILGVLPAPTWEFSLKWRIMGGPPVTPLDEAASRLQGDTVQRRDALFSERLPVYHRLDLRVDHRMHGKHWDIVAYLDIENAYDRRNVAFQYWHHGEQKVKTWYGWRIMPVFGVTVEF